MAIYMDVHIVPGVKARDVAEAHRKDILVQDMHECKCMTYWIDEERENVFCLIEAPNKEAVAEMHQRAHGLVPHKIIEVNSNVVESFLGRIYDPKEAQATEDGLKVFKDPSFRVLLITKAIDPVLLKYKLGIPAAEELLTRQNALIRNFLAQFDGREVEHEGNGFIASFISATKAVHCAMAIQKNMPAGDANVTGFRIGINAGEPVSKTEKFFGDTIQLAEHLCTIAKDAQIALSSAVRDLASKDIFNKEQDNILTLTPQDESLMELLFNQLESKWHDSEFSVADYCKAVAMSTSQLYRKTIELSGLSPNSLLKEFKLERAKDLMKKKQYSISQITFDSGFASPSYFTKCFKKKYGLLPMTYLNLLH
jgi:AraC-like DNA-binding protein